MSETVEQFAARYKCQSLVGDSVSSRLITERDGKQFVVFDTEANNGETHIYLTKPDAIAFAHDVLRAAGEPVPASRPALDVEFTGRELWEVWKSAKVGDDAFENVAAYVNRRHATDTGWVQVPTTQTSTIKTPKEMGVDDAEYVWCDMEGYDIPQHFSARFLNMKGADEMARIRSWQTYGGPLIERTQTTTRAWTAESVQACVGKRVMTVSHKNVTNADHWNEDETAEYIAQCFNNWSIARYLVVQDGPR